MYCKLIIIIIIITLLIINISSCEKFQISPSSPSSPKSCKSNKCTYWEKYFEKRNEYNKYKEESYNCPTFSTIKHDILMDNLNNSTQFNINF